MTTFGAGLYKEDGQGGSLQIASLGIYPFTLIVYIVGLMPSSAVKSVIGCQWVRCVIAVLLQWADWLYSLTCFSVSRN